MSFIGWFLENGCQTREAITAIISLMQQNGFSMEDICKNTGLSKEEAIKLMAEK